MADVIVTTVNELKKKLNRADTTIKDVEDAIERNGVEVPAGTTEYGELIDQIFPDTFILEDESGNQLVGVAVEDVAIFTADANDIREGKIAATGEGVTTGTKVIPSYNTVAGTKRITAGKAFEIPLYDTLNLCDFTEFQAIICEYKNSIAGSVGSINVVIKGKVYATNSTEIIASVSSDIEKKKINLGIVNESDNACLIRYFFYKEIY